MIVFSFRSILLPSIQLEEMRNHRIVSVTFFWSINQSIVASDQIQGMILSSGCYSELMIEYKARRFPISPFVRLVDWISRCSRVIEYSSIERSKLKYFVCQCERERE